MGEAQPESESEQQLGDGLEIFNDLLLLARRKNTGSIEAKMCVQHLDDVIQYHAGSRQAEREMS